MLLDSLKRKLDQMKSTEWAGRAAPVLSLSPDCAEDVVGGLKGSLRIFIRNAKGQESLFHEERLDGIVSETALDDRLAHALSITLQGHPRWPR
jgi:hypothetical protein